MERLSDVRAALRWGAWVFAGVTLLVFYRTPALHTATGYGHPGAQRAAYCASVAVWLLTALLPALPRARRAATWTLVAATLAGTAVATVTVPAAQQHTSTSWAAAANGWLLLAITSGRRHRIVVPLLLAPVGGAVVVAGTGGTPEMVLILSRTAGILGLQVPVALAAEALERIARTANLLRLQRDAIHTARVVADTVHDDRLRRSRAVAAVAEPVLAGLASPDTDPAALRTRCAMAAAQVRRLLAEWYRDGPDPLGAALASCLDRVQAAGVHVHVAAPAVHPDIALPAPLSAAACRVVCALTRAPVTRLRVTVLVTAGQARVGIAATGPPAPVPPVPAPLTVRTTVAGAASLVELACPL
ncbi:hypothetical protein [Dactylosporangium sp. NPDC051541]|uniref:hypothetical protein n=1 Tax=Dactylosporangium sp. NPDC051541 TaxID=3363977 RepID=UPI0037884857